MFSGSFQTTDVLGLRPAILTGAVLDHHRCPTGSSCHAILPALTAGIAMFGMASIQMSTYSRRPSRNISCLFPAWSTHQKRDLILRYGYRGSRASASGCGLGADRRGNRGVRRLCQSYGAEYLGDVRGTRKADLIAGAKALLFPSLLNEGVRLPSWRRLRPGRQ